MTLNRQTSGKVLFAAVLLAWALVCVPPAIAGGFPATGQKTAYEADKNDGVAGSVDIPDDGTLERGKTLKYKMLSDGTLKDKNTGLIWEVKCSACGGLHDVNNTYLWSGDGSEETIWDWLDDINSENGGKGYAGHNDWRIPNVKELQSIVDYERVDPSIDPNFGSTTAFNHWSSTTSARLTDRAWIVSFFEGFVLAFPKSDSLPVRAVRGGPK